MLTESTPVNSKVEKKNISAAERFREVRSRLGITQQRLADELLLTRNYIAKIESGLQEPSPRALMALESLRVRLVHNSEQLTHTAEAPGMIGSEPSAIIEEIDHHHAALLLAAENDPVRLGWIREQQRAHLEIPEHWQAQKSVAQKARRSSSAGPMVKITLPSQTQTLSTETGLPIPNPSRRVRSA